MFGKSKLSDLHLTPAGFEWKGQVHSADEIEHVSLWLVHYTQRMNFSKVGDADTATVEFRLRDGKRIELRVDEHGPMYGLNWNKTDEIRKLLEVHSALAGASFPHRVQRYERQLAEHGYFEHDNCKFYPPKKIVVRNREYDLSEYTLLRHPTSIELRRKESGALDTLKREFTFARTPGFDTMMDGDVAFFLLRKYFGIRWQ